MSRRRPPALKLLTIAIMAVLPAFSANAQSQPQSQGGNQQHDGDRGSRDRRQDSRSTLSDAVRRVERDTRGEVLSAERVQYDGRDMHRVKVVDDQGRVRVFMQDPQRRNDSGNRPSRNDGGDRGSSARRSPPARDDD